MLTLTFRTDNEAFSAEPGTETARILRDLAAHIATLQTRGITDDGGKLFDVNGNSVGTWAYAAEEEEA